MRSLLAGAVGALMLSPVALTGACELTLPGDDGGADAGSTSDVAVVVQTQTVSEQCTTIFTELCTQDISRCGEGGFSLDQCISANLPTCCTGCPCSGPSTPACCTDASQSSSSDVAACTSAIDSEDCNLIANSNTPAECVGVPATAM